jgi:hypothetical protein
MPDTDNSAFRRVRGLPLKRRLSKLGFEKPARRIERQAGFCFFKTSMIEAHKSGNMGQDALPNPVTNA